MKVLESKQHILTRKPRYYPAGNTLRGSMSSLFDTGFNCPVIILRTEGHMFWHIFSVCIYKPFRLPAACWKGFLLKRNGPSQISDHQQSMASRPLRGAILIPPSLLVVADWQSSRLITGIMKVRCLPGPPCPCSSAEQEPRITNPG